MNNPDPNKKFIIDLGLLKLENTASHNFRLGREQLGADDVMQSVAVFVDELQRRLTQHGWGTYASRHETMGIVTCETRELNEAVEHGTPYEVISELMDVAVACVFGHACQTHKTVDW